MIGLKSRGDWQKTFRFLRKASKLNLTSLLNRYGKKGVEALSAASPEDTGLMGSSWSYEVDQGPEKSTITWTNSDVENGFRVAIFVQYGHGTRGGGYVAGRDFINPAMKPIFDDMIIELWREIEAL